MGTCRPLFRRGTALTLAIVLSVAITGLVVTMSWVAASQANATGSLSKMDQAFFAAEAGAQRVAWYCKNGTMNQISSPLAGTVNGYSYSTSWTSVSASSIKITSVASLGSVSYAYAVTVSLPSGTPAVITTGGDVDGKNVVITGDVITGGDFTSGGSGAVTGNLTYYGTANNTNSVSGSVTHATGTFSGIDMAALGTTLIASAGQTLNGDQNDKTFNFTTVPGTSKVIYVNGSVTNPTFVGSGTIYALGTVSTGAFGSAAKPVNIVAAGDVTTSNNITMFGSIYTGGNWNRGKFDLTGMVYALGIVIQSNNGKSYLNMSTAPWFDPRTPSGSGGASGKLVFSGCTGPAI